MRQLLLAGIVAACALATPWAARAQSGGAAAAADETPISPRYVLEDPSGRAVSNEDFPGRYQLITFGYTSCPDVCPMTLSTMARARRALGALAERVQLVFISVDPERDTPEALKRYTAYFDADIVALTGTPERLRACADNFQVRYRKFKEPGAPAEKYAVDHTAGMYLLDPEGALVHRFPATISAASLGDRLRAQLLATGSP